MFAGVSYSKIVLGGIASWICGLVVYFVLLYVFYGQTAQASDLRWLISSSLLATALVLSTIHLPLLLLLRKLLGRCSPAALFPVVASLTFLVPTAFMIWMLSTSGSGFIRGLLTAEALLLDGLFFTVGVVFGLVFVWGCREKS